MSNNLGGLHIIPVLTPADTTTTVTEAFTTPIDTGEFTEGEIDLQMGVITGDTLVVKLYKDANTTTTGGTAVAFYYKLTAATGSDSDGAWTASASTGLTVTAGDDNKILRVMVDPQQFGGYPYAYLGIDPGASMTNFVHGAFAVVTPRNQQSVPPSIVD